LRALLEDGRNSYRYIAKRNNIPEKIVYQHIQKMEEKGIIVGATTQENHPDVGYPVVAEIYTQVGITDRVKAKIESYVREKQQTCYGIRAFLFNPINRTFVIIIQMNSKSQFNEIRNDIEQLILPERIYTDYWTGRTIEIPENLSFGHEEPIFKEIPNISFNRKPKTDKIDLKILEKLREDGRIPFAEIQKEVNVSIDTIARKYKRLRKYGIIKITLQINAKKLGYTGILFTRIKLRSSQDVDLALQALIQIPDIFGIVELLGEYNLRFFMLIRNIEHLLSTQEKLTNLPSFKEADILLADEFELGCFPTPRHWITNWR
jgi:Lrp/AsnC family transcriptional regulator, regulator for asnA, asnC and gidA